MVADLEVAGLRLALEEVLALQERWERGGVNNEAMERRGVLIRSSVPDILRNFLDAVDQPRELAVEGSDGAGRKARVPWTRVYSPTLSPKPTEGWYLVYLFSADGTRAYLSLNQGATDAKAGYRGRTDSFLGERVEWARSQIQHLDLPSRQIDLGEATPLARAYEASHVAGIVYDRDEVPDDAALADDLLLLLPGLEALYTAEVGLQALPTGYGPGEALYGFTIPAALDANEVAGVPNEPGVHVVWDTDRVLLFAGSSTQMRDRLRQHLSGDRTSSILREKVGRRLEHELGRESSSTEITSFLRRCTFAWRRQAEPDRLKARIMDELRPVFNDIRPKLEPSTATVLAVYVGNKGQANLQAGLDARTWGFADTRDDHAAVGIGDWLLLATGYTGGSHEASAEEWQSNGIGRVVLGRITRPLYVDRTPLWPEENVGAATYPFRLRFEIVDNIMDVEFGSGVIGPAVTEALRQSARNRGLGHAAPAAGSLFASDRRPAAESDPPSEPADLSRTVLAFSGSPRPSVGS